MDKNQDYWSDYWRTDGAAGEVFVDAKGDKPEYLKEFWAKSLSHLRKGEKILDVGCGAGSIFEDIDVVEYELYANDLSLQALKLLKQRKPTVIVSHSSATDLDFSDQYFDTVVSQFGIEYAGVSAFVEAIRVLKRDGKFTFVCHKVDGYIDQKNSVSLKGARGALDSRYIETGQALINALFSGSKTKIRKAKEQFQRSERQLSRFVKEYPGGIHSHLYLGFMKMFSRYQSYHQDDILKWLVDMRRDIVKSVNKTRAIIDVALDDKQVAEIGAMLKELGCSSTKIASLKTPNSTSSVLSAEVAWIISGIK